MAVVTLKDLMDPLTKIQAATESSAESIGAMSMAINSLAAKKPPGVTLVEKLLLVNSNKQTKLLEQIAKNSGSSDSDSPSSPASKDNKNNSGSSGSGGPKDNKGAADGAQALKALGIGAQTLATGLLIFNFVPKKAISKFKEALFDLYEILSNIDGKNIKEGAEAFQVMASSIGTFAKNLALSAILLPIGLIGVSLLKTVLKLITPAFIKLGEQSKEINKGAESLHLMGTSLLSFAKGLVIASLAAVVGIIGIPFLLISMVLIGGAMALLGKLSKPITKGARALDKMGDALKSFAIGLAVFALVAVLTVVALPFMVASLLLIGGAVAILGGKKMAKRIRKGTANLALLGLGVALFGLGYGVFAESFPSNVGLMDVLVQTAAIAGIGLATALIGKFDIKTIAKGALALVLNGAGLIVFALGYETYAKATKDVGLGDVLIQGLAILLVSGAAALIGKFGISNIAIGALAMALNGIGLYLFSLGYTPFAESTKSMTLGDVGIQAAVITMVGGLMTLAGIAVAASAGTALLGPALFAAAGGALLLLAPGLKAMRELKYTDKDAKDLAITLGAVTMAFSGVKEDDGFFGAIGSAFAQVGKSGAGLAAAAMYAAAGGALILLSKGLTAFKAVGFTVDDGKDLAIALGAVSVGFAQAGGESENPGGLLGAVFGNALSPNAVEKGIDSVMKSGEALNSIATGLTSFKGIEDPAAISEKIAQAVGFVSKAFASIADEGNVEAGGFFGSLLGIKKNKVAEGIESVQGAGTELMNIGKALESFAGLKDPEATAAGIKQVLGMVGQAFASIGGGENEETDGNWFISWDENKIQKGIEAVDGAGAALTDIAAGLKAFSGSFKPEAVAASIGTLLTSIGTAFSSLYATNPEISPQLHDFATFIVTLGDVAEKGLLDKAADGISKIADSINKIDIDKTVAFGELFKSSSKLSEDSAAYEALATAVSDIRDMMQSSGGGGSSEPGIISGLVSTITGGDTPAANQTEGSGNQADGSAKQFKALNITLSQLSSAIAKLPTDIAMIELQVSPPA